LNLRGIQGSIRPIVTLLFGLTVCAGFFMERISADQFIPIASAVLLWWFASRQQNRSS
jgi:hypothetical protein